MAALALMASSIGLTVLLALACPHPARSRTEVHRFMQLHPCPAGLDRGSQHRCRGYVVDHVCPLACCGKDEPANMQWQTVKAAKAKDRWELDCKKSCPVKKAHAPPRNLPYRRPGPRTLATRSV